MVPPASKGPSTLFATITFFLRHIDSSLTMHFSIMERFIIFYSWMTPSTAMLSLSW